MKADEFAAWWLVIRDMILVLSGVGWLSYEILFYDGPERRWPYVVAVGLGALPAFLRKAERQIRNGRAEPGEPMPGPES